VSHSPHPESAKPASTSQNVQLAATQPNATDLPQGHDAHDRLQRRGHHRPHAPAEPAPSQAIQPPDVAMSRGAKVGWTIAGALILAALVVFVHWLDSSVPRWAEGTGMEKLAKAIEYPVYAITVGFLANVVLSLLRVRRHMTSAFRTEFFIKTGLVLLGASINFMVIAKAALPAVAQAVLLIAAVFLFTWWFSGLLGLDDKLRALLSSAVSICGVSAAVAAAGAVEAKKEELAYTASLVIVFAVPMIFFLPWASEAMGLSPAVTAAGALAGNQPLQIATIVKVTQNALLGVVAVLLSMYFTFKVERANSGERPNLSAIWKSFPKFVLGFIIASIAATVFVSNVDAAVSAPAIATANSLRTWFLIAAFVSIGLEFSFGSLKEAGWKPILVFAAATVVNLAVGLGLALLLFGGFTF